MGIITYDSGESDEDLQDEHYSGPEPWTGHHNGLRYVIDTIGGNPVRHDVWGRAVSVDNRHSTSSMYPDSLSIEDPVLLTSQTSHSKHQDAAHEQDEFSERYEDFYPIYRQEILNEIRFNYDNSIPKEDEQKYQQNLEDEKSCNEMRKKEKQNQLQKFHEQNWQIFLNWQEQHPEATNDELIEGTYENNLGKIWRALRDGADINARNKITHATALIIAAGEGYKKLVSFFLNNTADINAQNNSGNTALIEAALHGHKNIVNLLLEKGADESIKNTHGKNALEATIDLDNFQKMGPPVPSEVKGLSKIIHDLKEYNLNKDPEYRKKLYARGEQIMTAVCFGSNSIWYNKNKTRPKKITDKEVQLQKNCTII